MAAKTDIELKSMMHLEPHVSTDGSEESFNSLIEDLQEDCWDDPTEISVGPPGAPTQVPEALLQTNHMTGLSELEVVARRRRYGLNEMSEHKNSPLMKVLSFFVGPIEFVMEVSDRK